MSVSGHADICCDESGQVWVSDGSSVFFFRLILVSTGGALGCTDVMVMFDRCVCLLAVVGWREVHL